jgi:hypothetical protein
MPLLRVISRIALPVSLTSMILACSSHERERHELFGPTYVDESGVEMKSDLPIEIEGEKNRIIVTVPTSLHPNYSLLKVVDSTNVVFTEFYATVELTTGQTYTFSAHHRLQGEPSHPEQEVYLMPDDTAHMSGRVLRITLKSTHPAILPRIEWQSWKQGI